MQIKRLPVSIIVGLGLVAVENIGCGPCLNIGEPSTTDEPAVTSTTDTDPAATTGTTAGTSTTAGTTGTTAGSSTTVEATTGPCLAPMPTTGELETTSGSDSDSEGTESSSGGDTSTTTGPCLAPPFDGDGDPGSEDDVAPPVAHDIQHSPRKGAVIERVLAASALPDDVVARLRERLGGAD